MTILLRLMKTTDQSY